MGREPTQEPDDRHEYRWLTLNRDTFEFFIASVKYYVSLLEADLAAVQADEDLSQVLDERTLATYPVAHELDHLKWLLGKLDRDREQGGADAIDYSICITHGDVRLIKSTAQLYLEHLHARRDRIAARPNVSNSVLEAVDQRLAGLAEKTSLGVFRDATPYPLAIEQVPDAPRQSDDMAQYTPSEPQSVSRSRPGVLESIQIRDTELRSRCLDLLHQFSEDGEHERLDTVVTEATRILENRLRLLSRADETCFGVDLAKHAFGGPEPRVVVSAVEAEQEAAHLLFRGVFGFIRNSVHHRLVEVLEPVRVLQIVGLVDYLLSIAEAGQLRDE